ncbi:recombinase family protein [Catenulispora yoronensis]
MAKTKIAPKGKRSAPTRPKRGPGARALVAARISQYTDESVSIPRQIKSGDSHAASKEWPVVGYVKDEDVSASKVAPMDRPALRKWLTDRADEWDVLIFWKLDRIIRSPADLTDMIRWCEEHGKNLVFVDDGFDLTTPIGKAMAYIAAVFAEMEVQRTSERVKAAQKELRTSVRWGGGRPPFGFMTAPAPDGKGRILVQDPSAVLVIRELGRQVMNSASRYYCANEFNDRGILTPTDHARDRKRAEVEAGGGTYTGALPQGEQWSAATVNQVLTNPATQGIKMHDGKPVVGEDGMPLRIAEPIFSDEEWARIQNQLTASGRDYSSRTADLASPYLDVLMHKCGKPLYRNKPNEANNIADRYRCTNRAAHPDGTGTIPTEFAHAAIEEYLLSYFGDVQRKRRVLIPGEDHTAELEEVEKALGRLRADRDAGDWDDDEGGYRSRLNALRGNIKRLKALPNGRTRGSFRTPARDGRIGGSVLMRRCAGRS